MGNHEDRFLSHLLIAGCNIGVQISICQSVRQHLRQSLVFSAFVIRVAGRVKLYIVINIVLDEFFNHAP